MMNDYTAGVVFFILIIFVAGYLLGRIHDWLRDRKIMKAMDRVITMCQKLEDDSKDVNDEAG